MVFNPLLDFITNSALNMSKNGLIIVDKYIRRTKIPMMKVM